MTGTWLTAPPFGRRRVGVNPGFPRVSTSPGGYVAADLTLIPHQLDRLGAA